MGPGRTFSISHLRAWLGRPVDPSSLGAFRIWFGLCILVEVLRYFEYGWIRAYFIRPILYFTYPGFDWVRPWPGDWMYAHFVVLGLAAAAVMLGAFYRVAIVVLFLAFTYVFLLDESNYLNHFYLISLLAFLLCWMPANRWAAWDRRGSASEPTVPFWTVFLLRAQLGLVYFYSGVARANSDWLRGQPLGDWLGGRSDLPVIGAFMDQPWATVVVSWGGLAFDLLIVPLALWRRTRPLAYLWAFGFHFLNLNFFSIGIFPWLAMGSMFIFSDPDWPKRLGRRVAGWFAPSGRRGVRDKRRPARTSTSPAVMSALGFAGLAAYLIVQVLLPLRHWLYHGNVSWTEEGHVLSWHMKLRDKRAELRSITVINPRTGERVEHDAKGDLTSRQYSKMTRRPRMVLHYVRWLADRYEHAWGVRPRIHVDLVASLNGRPMQPLVDPHRDLASVTLRFGPSDWIVPLERSAVLTPEPHPPPPEAD